VAAGRNQTVKKQFEQKATKATERGKNLRSLRLLLWSPFAANFFCACWRLFAATLNPSTENTKP
jgi:hypothetical protein